MNKLLLVLLLSLPLLAGDLQLKEGFVAAHTEIVMDRTIDPLNTSLQASLSINDNDILSLKGKFWIEMKSFSSDNEDRDEYMHEANEIEKYPLSTYTLSKVTKVEGDNIYEIEGNLNFFGHDKPFTAKAEIIQDTKMITISATSMILVSDYGLEMPCMLFLCVRDQVDLFVKAVLLK